VKLVVSDAHEGIKAAVAKLMNATWQRFRRTMAIMRTRPIFHSSDAAIRGHVFCSFLALSMQKHLDDLARQTGLALEGAVARSRPPATGAHPLPSRRLARAHQRRTGRDQAFQMRPCRPAVRRPPGSSPAATPVQIRSKTPRPPKA
jgi:hypothetical protein